MYHISQRYMSLDFSVAILDEGVCTLHANLQWYIHARNPLSDPIIIQ